MATSTKPQFSRSGVNKSGRRARSGLATDDDLEVIENWRTSHAHALNSFQTTLRNKQSPKTQIVQRLKRLPTILDKLQRRPTFSLTEMQDIAGCRIIVSDEAELLDFRSRFLSSRMGHVRLTSDDRYNYIERPKPDGYRGIHDVFSYRSRKVAGKPWEGLRIEIQYRTNAQHAWATAVEVAGFLTENDPKFGRGAEEYIEFFRCASELISRKHENRTGPYPRKPHSWLKSTMGSINEQTEIISVFERFNKLEDQGLPVIGGNVMLLLRRKDSLESRIEVKQFDSFSDALKKIGDFERADLDGEKFDVVVVRNVSGALISNAYRNYFSDTREFLKLLRESIA